MKYILLMCFLVSAHLVAGAQTKTTTTTTSKKTQTREKARIQRGSGQYHGDRDTTPGSPMGTGGAGGQEMAGSPAGSAIETDDQTTKANNHQSTSTQKRKTTRKTTTGKTTTRSSTDATPPTRSKPQQR